MLIIAEGVAIGGDRFVSRSTAPETAKEHSKINLKKVGKKAYQTSKKSSTKNHKNVIISLDKHLYLGI